MSNGFKNLAEEKQFIERLTQTIVWCGLTGSRADPRGSLRNFVPAFLSSPFHQVSGVCISRYWNLVERGQRDLQQLTEPCGGRLLAYFPDDNLTDGAAEEDSEGFFDVHNVPPCDTWVWPSNMKTVE